ncbi:MAG TPA: sporulation integral membrane protein YtvI [Candidatus Fimenecus excrementavium]|nr:sporulation integral membrane protein YtvI [Candidatus Fimenecus excrementavium]
MDKIEKRRSFIINTVFVVIIVGLFYLAIKYALGIVWPFVVAFFLAMLLQRPVNFLSTKTPLKRGISSVIMVLFVLVIVGSILGLIIGRIVIELKGFFDYLLIKMEDAPAFVDQIQAWLSDTFSFLPKSLHESIMTATENFLNRLMGIEAKASADAIQAESSGIDFSLLSSPLGAVWGTAKQIPMIAVGVLVCVVSCCFMTTDYRTLRDMILSQLSQKRQSAVIRTKQVTFSTLGKMGKAYSIILFVTFMEMLLGLSFLKLIHVYDSGYIFAIAFITAVVDIIPVLGTGTILIPWALWSLFTGDVGLGIGLLVVYAIISVIRQVIEPKLVASQLGLPPFVTIMAMYIGSQLFGFIGLFLLPITVMLLKVLNDEGVIHIFKKKAPVVEEVNVSAKETAPDEKSGEKSEPNSHD